MAKNNKHSRALIAVAALLAVPTVMASQHFITYVYRIRRKEPCPDATVFVVQWGVSLIRAWILSGPKANLPPMCTGSLVPQRSWRRSHTISFRPSNVVSRNAVWLRAVIVLTFLRLIP